LSLQTCAVLAGAVAETLVTFDLALTAGEAAAAWSARVMIDLVEDAPAGSGACRFGFSLDHLSWLIGCSASASARHRKKSDGCLRYGRCSDDGKVKV